MSLEIASAHRRAPQLARIGLFGAAALLLLGGIFFFRAQKPAAPPGNAGESRPVPVVIAAASLRDVPVYLEGLGNAVPLVTVTVRPQVDGPLLSVLFKEGQPVKKGDLLGRVDPRPFAIQLHQAEAALARDQAQAKNAQVNLTRYTALHAQGLASEEQLDDQRATAAQLLGTTRADEAQIENAKLQLTYTEVRSPVDGVTGVRQVDAGNVVHASDPNGIVVVTQLDPMGIVFALPQDDLPQINEQIARGLAIEAYSRDGERLLGTGTLTLVDNQVSPTTATVRLKGVVPNPNKMLWPNEFVRARLLLTTRTGVLSIPAPAVQRGPEGAFVYVIDSASSAVLRKVTVEAVQDQWAIVKTGLQAGDQVVVEGQSQLRPGAKVSLRTSVNQPATEANGAPPSAAAPGAGAPAGRAGGKHGGAAP
jgi:multidrug efflux system membrane fusion protein